MIYLLPYKKEFLLEIQNNNFSLETVYNYRRDLTIIEAFLNIYNVDFNQLRKKHITFLKGFLMDPDYLEKIVDWWEKKKEELTDEEKAECQDFFDSFTNRPSRRERNKPLSARSINRILSCFRTYLKYLADFDLLEMLPISSDSIKLVKLEKKKIQVAELDELIKLMEFPSIYEKDELVASRNRAILELLFSSGLRISELVKLNRADINDEGKIYIQGKGKKQRFIYITPRAMYYIKEYLKKRTDNLPALFIPTRGGRNGSKNPRISTNYIQEKIALYRKLLGIVVPTSPHSFRHGFATYLAENGASPAAIQILLGHESLNTTDRYVHAGDKFAQETHRKYHPLYNN